MTSPPPYVITRDYSDYQAAHQLPGPAIAGSDLDSEFNNLVVTTNAIINNLNLLQRSDGALNNQSVTPDTINSALAILIAGWNIRGPWVTATVYALKDYVTNGGNGYVCIIANTGGTFATDLAAGKWALVSTQGNAGAQGIQGNAGPTGPAGPVTSAYRNRFFNGDFRIDQRNAGAAVIVTNTATYVLDRWYAGTTGSGLQAVSVQRVVGSNANQFATRITGAGANTGTIYGTRIEATNCFDLKNADMCVSFEASSPSITSVTWTAYRANSADNWGSRTQLATGTIPINSTPTVYNFTFNCGANANNGINIEFTTGILTFASTLQYEIMQLETGTTPTVFERRPIGAELLLCQRYYTKSYDTETAPGTATRLGMVFAGVNSGGAIISMATVSFPVPMRATPSSVNLWDGAGASNKSTNNTSSTPGSTTMSDAGTVAVAFNLSSRGFMFSPATNPSSFQHYSVDTEL